MPKKILNAKIACLDFSLQKSKLKLGVQVKILTFLQIVLLLLSNEIYFFGLFLGIDYRS